MESRGSSSAGGAAQPAAATGRRPSVLPGPLLRSNPATDESILQQNSLGQRANIVVLAGSGGVHLAEELTGIIGLPPSSYAHCVHQHFADGESLVEIKGNVRGRDVFVVQALCHPVNDNLIELALILSALSRASAGRVTAIVPYLSYSRQTRKTRSRVPISSADVAMLLEESGLNQIVCLDVHCGQIAGFFSPLCCLDNLSCIPAAARLLFKRGLRRPVVLAPHATGVTRAKEFLDTFSELARVSPSELPTLAMLFPAGASKQLELIGEVDGCDVVIVDDMIDTGKSVCRSCRELQRLGAARVFAFATHGIFSHGAYDRLASSGVELIVVTNTCELQIAKDHPVRSKLQVLSAAPVLAHHLCELAELPKPEVDPLAPTFAMHCANWEVAAEAEADSETSSMAMHREMAAIGLELREGAPASPSRRNERRESLDSSELGTVSQSERALEEECAFLLESSGYSTSPMGSAMNITMNSASPPARRGVPR